MPCLPILTGGQGNAVDEIVRTAEEEHADLIVIATRG
jgi:nucleotide-binding universal stress UspA family protein